MAITERQAKTLEHDLFWESAFDVLAERFRGHVDWGTVCDVEAAPQDAGVETFFERENIVDVLFMGENRDRKANRDSVTGRFRLLDGRYVHMTAEFRNTFEQVTTMVLVTVAKTRADLLAACIGENRDFTDDD